MEATIPDPDDNNIAFVVRDCTNISYVEDRIFYHNQASCYLVFKPPDLDQLLQEVQTLLKLWHGHDLVV